MTRTVFAGGRVFDGTGSKVAEADVAVENGRFVDVGPGLDGDDLVDVGGTTLLPGLFDCHVHLMFSGLDLLKDLMTPFSLRFYEAARNLRRTLDIGITTVRDAGGADLGVKTAVEQGMIEGPRMQISLVMLSQTGGHGDSWMPCGSEIPGFFPSYPGMPSGLVDGPEEMRRKVRELVRAGADVIKVATTGGVLSPSDDPRHAHFRPDELEMLVSEAEAAGLWVMAHAQGTPGIKAAIRAGIRSIDHGVYLDDEAIEMMLERGTFLVPTLVAPTGVVEAAGAGMSIPEAMVQKARDVIDTHRDSFKRAVAAGVKVAMGTDSAVTPHGENLKELALMGEGGMEGGEVLVSTTSRGAELMGLQAELGTIEPGKRADLVVVDGDPLDLVNLPDHISAVYKDGRLVSGGHGPSPSD
jgi:imidazolonepropionase-like amidohydrolase